MNNDLHLSDKGGALIKSFESCQAPAGDGKFKPYLCPAHVLTIGWGHTNDAGRPFGPNDLWSQADCDEAFVEDMQSVEASVKHLVQVVLNQNQFDALVSFTYNCGAGNLAISTLLKKLNAGDFDGAALEFPRWNRGGGKVLPGLVKRRAAEALLFQSIDSIAPAGEPMAQDVDIPPAGAAALG